MNCDDLNKGCICERVVLFTRHRIIVELGNPYTKAISEQKRPHEVLEFLQETQGFEQTKSHQPHTFATQTRGWLVGRDGTDARIPQGSLASELPNFPRRERLIRPHHRD